MTITSITGKYGDMPRCITVQSDEGMDLVYVHYLTRHNMVEMTREEAITLRDMLTLIYPPRSLYDRYVQQLEPMVRWNHARNHDIPSADYLGLPHLRLVPGTERRPRMG